MAGKATNNGGAAHPGPTQPRVDFIQRPGVAFAMEEITIVRADPSQIDLLAAARLEFALDMHPGTDRSTLPGLASLTCDYIRRHMEDGSYVGFLGRMGERTVACASLLIYELPPLIGRPERKQGHVLNVYTAPDVRGRGIGRAMMEAIIKEGRAQGLFRLFLNATKMGEPLYRSLGFHEQEEQPLVLPL